MPRPNGIVGRVSRPDIPVCGQFHVRRVLEIQDKFTGAAMHTPRPSRVTSGKAQREQMFSGCPPKADLLQRRSFVTEPDWRAVTRNTCPAVRRLPSSRDVVAYQP